MKFYLNEEEQKEYNSKLSEFEYQMRMLSVGILLPYPQHPVA